MTATATLPDIIDLRGIRRERFEQHQLAGMTWAVLPLSAVPNDHPLATLLEPEQCFKTNAGPTLVLGRWVDITAPPVVGANPVPFKCRVAAVLSETLAWRARQLAAHAAEQQRTAEGRGAHEQQQHVARETFNTLNPLLILQRRLDQQARELAALTARLDQIEQHLREGEVPWHTMPATPDAQVPGSPEPTTRSPR